jgi:large subunit ribosomal protein L20
MARVKRGPKKAQRRKRLLKLSKGFYGTKGNAARMAMQAVDKALGYSTRDRRTRKRNFRALWIVRINAAARLHGLSYNRLISGLKAAGNLLDRKVLADLAVSDPTGFGVLAAAAKRALENRAPRPAEG